MSVTSFSRQAFDLDRYPTNGISRGQAFQSEDRSATAIGRLTGIPRAVASGTGMFCLRFLAALHASRQRRANIEITRYRHLLKNRRHVIRNEFDD